METDQFAAGPVPKLGPEIKAKIGQQLRAMYSDVVSQGVPDRFVDILRQLDERGSDLSDADGSGPSVRDRTAGAAGHDERGHEIDGQDDGGHAAGKSEGSRNEPS